MKVMAVAALAVALMGCGAIEDRVERIDDDTLAALIQEGSWRATEFALKKSIARAAADVKVKIVAEVNLGVGIIETKVMPVLMGADLKPVLRSSLDQALVDVYGKVSAETRDTVQLAIATFVSQLDLPKNPADQLSDRSRKAIAGLLAGVAKGARLAIAGN